MPQPNIIFIMADDMGYGDLSCYNENSKIPTPNMDRMALEGLKFTDAHTPSSLCTPTRYGVLTGRHCWRTRLKQGVISGYAEPLIEESRPTLASILKDAGYHTACIGKWHIGAAFSNSEGEPTEKEEEIDFSAEVRGGPADLGFDYAYYNSGCGTCAPPYGFIENRHFIDDEFKLFKVEEKDDVCGVGPWGQWEGMMGNSWVTHDADPIIADKACEYIEDRASEDEPFFLYLAPNAPHEPCVDRFVPDFAKGKTEAGPRGDLVWLFDWIVGRVNQSLEKHGITDNTLVVITSDNGALAGDFVLNEDGSRKRSDTPTPNFIFNTHNHLSNGNWRGYKSHIWEGGHRVPFIMRWPNEIQAGGRSEDLFCLTDTMATLAAAANTSVPDHGGEDSLNLLPSIVREHDAAPIREEAIHHSGFGVFSIRTGKWKLVQECQNSGGWPFPRGTAPEPGSPGQLYDLETDPEEKNNLWEKEPEMVRKLDQRIRDIRESERTA